MQIKIYWFWEASRLISSPIVVIDAWAATTNLSLILSKKPKRLILVNEKNYQKALKIYKGSFLMGESFQLPPTKFNFTNYPSDLYQADLKNQSLLYMTANGTRVFEKFKDKKMVIGAAFNNLAAVVSFLKKYSKISLVLAGDYPHKVLEDKICAQIYLCELRNKKYNWQAIKKRLSEIIVNYYTWPATQEKEGLRHIFEKSRYNIIPTAKVNKEGFVEIKDLLS